MKTRIVPSLSLFLLLLAACAPATAPTEPTVGQPDAPVAAESTPTAFPPSDSVPAPTAGADALPTEVVTPLPVATSRGDSLEATDPRGVTLASGGVQLVEFFRFT